LCAAEKNEFKKIVVLKSQSKKLATEDALEVVNLKIIPSQQITKF
jgi:hypothetical protein